jgi:branched-chain amino acid transport system ATP-binding protein
MSLLSVQGLGKSFGGVVAASNISFVVERGELLALIGPNGAGRRPPSTWSAANSRLIAAR